MPVQALQANPQVSDDAVAWRCSAVPGLLHGRTRPACGSGMSDLALDLGQKAANPVPERAQARTCSEAWLCFVTPASPSTDQPRATRCTHVTGASSCRSRRVPLTFIPYYAWSNRQRLRCRCGLPCSTLEPACAVWSRSQCGSQGRNSCHVSSQPICLRLSQSKR